MNHLIDWAFTQDLPAGEKLLLVYLASQASAGGFGYLDIDAAMAATGYAKRSLQRARKDLKDKNLLVEYDKGGWYSVGFAEGIYGGTTFPEVNATAHVSPDASPKTLAAIEDTARRMIDYLTNSEHRLGRELDRLAVFASTFHVEQLAADPEPAPVDPVLENPLFQTLLDAGVDDARAYELSKADLNLDDAVDLYVGRVHRGENVEVPQVEEYADTADGRYERILDILHGADAALHDDPAWRTEWRKIERSENKFTVEGETDAFLQLYPAIVATAKANVGELSIRHFCNLERVENGMAPWDKELNAVNKDDPRLSLEIEQMLDVLAKSNDPRFVVQPRTQETGDDGVVRMETLLGYHRRVKGKYDDYLKIEEGGLA